MFWLSSSFATSLKKRVLAPGDCVGVVVAEEASVCLCGFITLLWCSTGQTALSWRYTCTFRCCLCVCVCVRAPTDSTSGSLDKASSREHLETNSRIDCFLEVSHLESCLQILSVCVRVCVRVCAWVCACVCMCVRVCVRALSVGWVWVSGRAYLLCFLSLESRQEWHFFFILSL